MSARSPLYPDNIALALPGQAMLGHGANVRVVTLHASNRWANLLRMVTGCMGAECRGDTAVLLKRRSVASDYRRILVPVSLSRFDENAARSAMRLSAGAQVTLLHAFQLREERMPRISSAGIEYILSLRNKAREVALAQMRALVDELRHEGRLISYAVHHGSPVSVISAYASRFQPDLIVLSRKRMLGEMALLSGAVVRDLASRTSGDVLIVPEG
jgi:nucleotide-binding universal stress UspA family protein